MDMRSDEKLLINLTMSIKVRFLLFITPLCNPRSIQLGYNPMLLLKESSLLDIPLDLIKLYRYVYPIGYLIPP